MGFKYIIVIIDSFTRYVELFLEQEVTAIAAADALWRHTCRFTASIHRTLRDRNGFWFTIYEPITNAF